MKSDIGVKKIATVDAMSIARAVLGLPIVNTNRSDDGELKKMSGEKIGWKDLEIGAVVTEPGSASAYKTGDWRSERLVRENERCIKCGICYIYCPEACIREDEEGYFEADLYYCKGCGICAHECPRGVITIG